MLDVKPVILYTDVVLWALLAVVLLYVWHVRREPGLAAKWRRVLADRTAVAMRLPTTASSSDTVRVS